VLRVWVTVFGAGAGASAGLGADFLLWLGLATLAFGSLGVLASQDLGRVVGYSAIVSSGTLLAALALGRPAATGAALFYLVGSSLALGALLLLAELIRRLQDPAAAMLALTMEAFGMADAP